MFGSSNVSSTSSPAQSCGRCALPLSLARRGAASENPPVNSAWKKPFCQLHHPIILQLVLTSLDKNHLVHMPRNAPLPHPNTHVGARTRAEGAVQVVT
jgi:hypothetical protein